MVAVGGALLVGGSTAGVVDPHSDHADPDGDAVVAELRLDDLGTDWIRQLDATDGEYATDVASDGSSIYVGAASSELRNADENIFSESSLVWSLDADGTPRWVEDYGADVVVSGVAATAGGVVVHGTTQHGTHLPDAPVRGGGGDDDVFLQGRSAADGAVLWTRAFGWRQHDVATGFAVGDGCAVLTGFTVRHPGGPSSVTHDRGRVTAYTLPG